MLWVWFFLHQASLITTFFLLFTSHKMFDWLTGSTGEEPAAVTEEQAQAAIAAEKSKLDGDDDFQDALQDDNADIPEKTFEVTTEELKIIRAELATEFPEDYQYLSDDYILAVASKPYSKDPTVRRPLEYSMEKLSHVMTWRAEEGAPEMKELIELANGPESDVEDAEKLTKAKAMVTSLNYASMYWHGFTKDGHPVLWLRTNRKPWYPDVDAEVNALIAMADAGIRCMPKGVTDFVVVSDSSSPPPPNPTFMIKMLKALVKGYPDRLHLLTSAPVSSIVQFVMNLLLPLMPGRLANKVKLMDTSHMVEKLKDMLEGGENDVPTFFGGPCDHDVFYPEEGYSENKGQGSLKFDFFGMIERLEKAKNEYEAAHPPSAES